MHMYSAEKLWQHVGPFVCVVLHCISHDSSVVLAFRIRRDYEHSDEVTL